jgi:hypothetical protein
LAPKFELGGNCLEMLFLCLQVCSVYAIGGFF